MSRDPIIDEIRQRVTMAQVMGYHLRRGECEFCGSSTGLSVNHLHNTFKCFSCDRSGDVFTWLQFRDGLRFRQAVEQLAAMIQLSLRPNKERGKTLTQAAQFFRKALESSPEAMAFLNKRGFTDGFLYAQNIGFCDQYIINCAIKEIGLEPLLKAQLVRQDGSAYYQGRVTIPVRDTQGNIVNFQGRSTDGTEPKYLALPGESEFGHHSISSHLYNEHQLKIFESKENSYVFICEGVPDTWTLMQADLNAVGLLGNSALKNHAHKFRNFSKVYLILDNDKATAGKLLQHALYLQIACPNTEIRIVRIPQPPNAHLDKSLKLDVNAWFMSGQGNLETLRALTRDAIHAMDFMLDAWASDRTRLEFIFAAVQNMPDRQQMEWLTKLSHKTGVSLESTLYAASIVSDIRKPPMTRLNNP